MTLRAGTVKHVGWTCPTCGKSMASEGGFKVHVSLNHAGDSGAPLPDPQPLEPVATPSEIPTLTHRRQTPAAVGGIWEVKITAEGAGQSISPAVADTFLAAFRDEHARVSTTFNSDKTCRYAIELTVHADGVLTAVLRGISHFQAAVHAAKLPAVRVVGINAQEPATTAAVDRQ